MFSVTDTPNDSAQSQNVSGDVEDLRDLILHAFVPHVAVYSSSDTDDLVQDKGFRGGLLQMLRPFGDQVQGKITVRDSFGASRSFDDFAVRFVKLGANEDKTKAHIISKVSQNDSSDGLIGDTATSLILSDGELGAIEKLVDICMARSEDRKQPLASTTTNQSKPADLSTYYKLYFRKLLSGFPLTPHETFSHPVACVIAISSRNASPIEALRQLYNSSTKLLPAWVHNEYLRYYVLVHDEERDEINKSNSLFEQMKRHFGLHCHLLRLRSTHCVPTDDDSARFPDCKWTSAAEVLDSIQNYETEENITEPLPCIFGSDITAIGTFIREMVTQSILPSMERSVSTWNDQVVSRRKGLSGRFMTLSKKWPVFGTNTKSTQALVTTGSTAGSSTNYDSQGFYRPENPEALMRKLADYAFMLRDWKLAHSVYDMLRTDFNNDKAWLYFAATNEMAAISWLLTSRSPGSKPRPEVIDQMLESATYSYITRCGFSFGAIRCVLLSMELLTCRGNSGTEDAAKWGAKLLEMNVVGQISEALIQERIAACFAMTNRTRLSARGTRTRKSALWNILASENWLKLGKYSQAEACIQRIRAIYDGSTKLQNISKFLTANGFLLNLERELKSKEIGLGLRISQSVEEDEIRLENESESFDIGSKCRSRASPVPMAALETAPLKSLLPTKTFLREDDFE